MSEGEKVDERERFIMELEFVQSLANPMYLKFLAQQRYFHDEAFLNYLEYLKYWQKPEYAQYIRYPHCLHFLELLQDKTFRDRIGDSKVADFCHRQQFYHWQYYRNKRIKFSSASEQ